MAKRTGPTNPELQEIILELKKESTTKKAPIWDKVADDLEKPTRQRRIVNISKINRTTKPNETIIVPGKVLGSGILEHSVTIAAFSFSDSAKQTITNAKGKCLTIQELLKQNPNPKTIRIIG